MFDDAKLCHVSVWYLSAILIHLPGNDVIYGSYEALHNSAVNGSARVVGAVLKSMAMAVCLSIGWQMSGREAVTHLVVPGLNETTVTLSGAQASFVPFSSCVTDSDISWRLAFGGYNIILIINICVTLNMRLRKMWGPVAVAYCSLFLFGYLTFGLGGHDTLASCIVNVVVLIVAGTLAVMLELFNGCPSCISVIPVVLILAPGSGAIKISLGDMQQLNGVADLSIGIWDDLVLESVSYAVGLYVVLELWKAPLRIKRNLRASIRRFTKSVILYDE